MTIRSKVLAAFGIVSVLMVVMVGVHWWTARRVHQYSERTTRARRQVQAYMALSVDAALWFKEVSDALLLGEREAAQEAERRKMLQQSLAEVSRLAAEEARSVSREHAEGEKARLDGLRSLLEKIASEADAALVLRASGKEAEVRAHFRDAIERTFDKEFTPTMAAALDQEREELAGEAANLDAMSDRCAVLGAALSLVAVATVGLLGLTLVRSSMASIRKLSAGTSAIGLGNLSYRVGHKGRDELGQLAERFDAMAAQLEAEHGRLLTAQHELEQKNVALGREVGERRKAEEALRQSAERLAQIADEQSLLLDYTRDFVYRMDAHGVFTYLSPAVEHVTGYSVADWLAHYSKYMTDSPVNEKVYEYTERALNTGQESPPYLVEVYHKDGRRLMLEVNERPHFADGKVAGIVGVARDVTERVRAEAELRESREKYLAIVENIGIGVALIGPRMEILDLNKTMRKWFPKVDPAQRAVCYEAYNDPPRTEPCSYCPTIQTLRDGQVHEAVTETPAGDRTVNYRVVSSPVLDAQGRVVAAIEMVEDITERKRAEAALRESEERFRAIFDNAQDGILVADAATKKLLFGNRAIGGMLGYTPEELRAVGVTEIHPPKDLPRVLEAFEKQARQEIALAPDLPVQRKDGSVFYVDISSFPISLGGKTCLVGVFRDITDRKKAEGQLRVYAQQLESLNAELARSNRDLQEFTYTVSHDLQEPLRKINTFAQFLMEDCGDRIPDAGQEHLRRIQGAAGRMRDLIRHLLALARVGTHGGALVPTDMDAVVGRALDTLSEQARDSGAEIAVRRPLPCVMGDAVQLEQVVQNIVANALKFRPTDRSPQVEIAARLKDGMAEFAVSDNGIGIEARHLGKLFGIFQRLHSQKEYDGAGIGLALCAKIVGRHGGRVWVESQVNEGSTFFFTLPIAPENTGEGHGNEPERAGSAGSPC